MCCPDAQQNPINVAFTTNCYAEQHNWTWPAPHIPTNTRFQALLGQAQAFLLFLRDSKGSKHNQKCLVSPPLLQIKSRPGLSHVTDTSGVRICSWRLGATQGFILSAPVSLKQDLLCADKCHQGLTISSALLSSGCPETV